MVLNLCFGEGLWTFSLILGRPEYLVNFLECQIKICAQARFGALQAICYEDRGRMACIENGVVSALVALLDLESDEKVVVGAIGALHNISSDPTSIKFIRNASGVEKCVSLLESPNVNVCGSAAGILQNLSHEVAAREIINKSGAIDSLIIDLLFADDVQSQVCSAGTLLNMIYDADDPCR